MNNLEFHFTDEQLAILIQRGDKEKFGVLMDRYEEKIFRYGKKFLFHQNNIEDMVQEIFLKAYQNMQSFDVKQKFSSWIYRIAHNTFINALKKKLRNPLYFFDFDTLIPPPVYDDPSSKEQDFQEISKILTKGLKKVGPNYREILILYYVEDLSYKEISDILRIPTGTVGIRLKRAKAELKKLLPKDVINDL